MTEGQKMNKALNYLTAGAVATIPMTLAMMAMYDDLPEREKYPLPPRKITMNLAQDMGIKHYLGDSEKVIMTMAAHFGYGAFAGAFYFPLMKKLKVSDVLGGMSYGLFIWGVSYLGILPATKLHPAATKMPKERNALMIAAHLVWGGALGIINSSAPIKKVQ